MTSSKLFLIVFLLSPSLSFGGSSMDWVSISSDSLVGSRASGYVTFKGNVVAEGGMVLCADEFKVTYGKSKVVKDVTAVGSVKVFKDNKKASGDKAVYNKKENTMIITGNAVLSECQGDVKGESIVFNIDGSGAEIKGSSEAEDKVNGERVSVVLTADKDCGEGSTINYMKRVESAKDLCRKSN